MGSAVVVVDTDDRDTGAGGRARQSTARAWCIRSDGMSVIGDPRSFWPTALLGTLLILSVTTLAHVQTPEEIFDQAVADFSAGRVAESAAGFDQVARAQPESAPQLWQRGIALYYAGRYEDCRRQFESHLTVNPSDVENAAWHFLCVARAESPEAAREALLPVGPDPRRPMREIYEMFSGRMTPQDVLSAAGGQPRARFYAHLYRGLYHAAFGRTEAAREEIFLAADDQFAEVGGYMHMVAVVHRNLLGR